MSITREKIDELKALATHCPDATVVLSKDGFLDVCTSWLSMADRIAAVEKALAEYDKRPSESEDDFIEQVCECLRAVRAALAGEGK